MNRQSGFTLIELVIVIVILGILAATALPRFSDLSGDARAAKAQAGLAAIKSAAVIAHATALARNNAAAVSIEDQNITLVNLYPTADANGIVNAANLLAADGYASAGGGGGAGVQITYTVDGRAACAFSYTSPAAANTAPTYSITASTTNCI